MREDGFPHMIDFFTYYYPLGVGMCIYVPINRSYKVDDFLTPMIHPTGNYGCTGCARLLVEYLRKNGRAISTD
jgi:hypothetical protein